jgi:hypothetical protein
MGTTLRAGEIVVSHGNESLPERQRELEREAQDRAQRERAIRTDAPVEDEKQRQLGRTALRGYGVEGSESSDDN